MDSRQISNPFNDFLRSVQSSSNFIGLQGVMLTSDDLMHVWIALHNGITRTLNACWFDVSACNIVISAFSAKLSFLPDLTWQSLHILKVHAQNLIIIKSEKTGRVHTDFCNTNKKVHTHTQLSPKTLIHSKIKNGRCG